MTTPATPVAAKGSETMSETNDNARLRRFYFMTVGVSLAIQLATLVALVIGLVRL